MKKVIAALLAFACVSPAFAHDHVVHYHQPVVHHVVHHQVHHVVHHEVHHHYVSHYHHYH